MIAVDTNILVYAHRQDSSFHEKAFELIKTLAEGDNPWTIPWPCVHEFLAIVTHQRIYNPPSSIDSALKQASAWLKSPSIVLLGERWPGYFGTLSNLLKDYSVSGAQVYDARVAAVCIDHGIEVLFSADRDFSRFTKYLKISNPLI